jgi:hypothetical protein
MRRVISTIITVLGRSSRGHYARGADGWQTRCRMCVVWEDSRFDAAWVLKLGTRASPSKVNKIDTTEQLIEDGVIGLSEKAKAAPERRV